MEQQLVHGGPALFQERLDELVDIYREAFLELHEPHPARAAVERRAHMLRHAARPGLDAVLALGPADQVVGFCYSHLGQPGQWWFDVVAAHLPPETSRQWLTSCREVVELHVRPQWQGRGLGAALLDHTLATALEDPPVTGATSADEHHVVMSALDDPQSRRGAARRLYRSRGFTPLLEGFHFPGSALVYAVLGRRAGEAT